MARWLHCWVGWLGDRVEKSLTYWYQQRSSVCRGIFCVSKDRFCVWGAVLCVGNSSVCPGSSSVCLVNSSCVCGAVLCVWGAGLCVRGAVLFNFGGLLSGKRRHVGTKIGSKTGANFETPISQKDSLF